MITLVKSAKVDVSKSNFIYPFEMKEWIEHYNRAPIKKDFVPRDIFEHIHKCEILLCSNFSRSLDSLRLIGREPYSIDITFNEVQLPYINYKGLRLSPKVWLSIFKVAWLFGYSNHSESYKKAQKRALMAAEKLIALENKRNKVVLIGHGIMNRLIFRALKKKSYVSIQATRDGNWGYEILVSKTKG